MTSNNNSNYNDEQQEQQQHGRGKYYCRFLPSSSYYSPLSSTSFFYRIHPAPFGNGATFRRRRRRKNRAASARYAALSARFEALSPSIAAVNARFAAEYAHLAEDRLNYRGYADIVNDLSFRKVVDKVCSQDNPIFVTTTRCAKHKEVYTNGLQMVTKFTFADGDYTDILENGLNENYNNDGKYNNDGENNNGKNNNSKRNNDGEYSNCGWASMNNERGDNKGLDNMSNKKQKTNSNNASLKRDNNAKDSNANKKQKADN